MVRLEFFLYFGDRLLFEIFSIVGFYVGSHFRIR